MFKKLFSALLIVEAIILLERLLVETSIIESMPHFLGISYPISFLKPPLMLLMVLALTRKDFRLSKFHFWHLIPFGLILLMNLPFYTLNGSEKLDLVKSFMENVPSYKSFEFYFTLSFFLYIGAYIFLSVKKLNVIRQQVINNTLINWYRIVLICYSVFLLAHLIYFVIQPLGGLSFEIVNQLSMLAMTLIIQSVAFKLIEQSNLLNSRTPEIENINQRKVDLELIIKAFDQDKIHLIDDLNLSKFSNELNLNKDYVSALINQKFDCSFSKLVKTYRLEEAKLILKNSDPAKIKLIDVAFDAGFNNKVSFYRAFKESENMSPSDYLKKL
ncbi:MAG: helix-turn-helix domain-containing protein [Maribacter sp.]|uniref:helix-turn-helix domain-containing protein n=1 Tax=Maribacter sp. TaxID=1897614 RepID=UPI00329A524E